MNYDPTTARPENLTQLLIWLKHEPCCLATHLDGTVHRERFLRVEGSGLWFTCESGCAGGHFLPVNCRMTDNAARNEGGLTFDDTGFSFSKFGRVIRYEYKFVAAGRGD